MATGRIPTTANSPLTTKGDLFGYSTTQARVAVGSDGDTLVADSAAATGLRWQGDYAAGKNRIINGNMVIDQRNTAAAAVTVNTNVATYSVDRFFGVGQSTDGVYTLGQDTSAPTGFTKSLKATVTTADTSLGSTQSYSVLQSIEGFNVADFDFGAATAKTITVSFWVRSSLTGTFGGAVRNSAANRAYPFNYSISVADTWEKKSITISGDTTGTWIKDSGLGIRLGFSLGAGNDLLGTANAWAGANLLGVTGQVQVIGTLNATWYLTGVQVEIGNVATAFQTATGTIQGELAACQRYYLKSYAQATAPGTASNTVGNTGYSAISSTNTHNRWNVRFPVNMRGTPTITLYSTSTGTSAKIFNEQAAADVDGVTQFIGESGFHLYTSSGTPALGNQLLAHYQASAEL